ncbi:hypothetical protein B6K89_01645 [Bacillus subtilis]|nr:hypothetical protein B6K89_01645 [Bacillus subtilis]
MLLSNIIMSTNQSFKILSKFYPAAIELSMFFENIDNYSHTNKKTLYKGFFNYRNLETLFIEIRTDRPSAQVCRTFYMRIY